MYQQGGERLLESALDDADPAQDPVDNVIVTGGEPGGKGFIPREKTLDAEVDHTGKLVIGNYAD